MSQERTLVFLKPDAIQRRLVGEILSRFERKGFLLRGLKMFQMSEEFAREHYAAHRGKEFYEPLVRYITSGPVIAAVLEGKAAVRVVREMMGETFGSESPPGSIRGDFALSNRYNLIHGSDSPESAKEEIERFFDQEELCNEPDNALRWIYDMTEEEPV
ncbi:MAG: nucleoside-diphosphate kinase [Candidatus Brocadiia bacterium]